MKGYTKQTKQKIFTIPNLLSAFRIGLIPVLAWLYCRKQDYALTTGVLILSGLTDVVDGFIARRFHMISDLGKILDPVADKLTQAVMLFCLVTRFRAMLIPLSLMVVKEIFAAVTGLMAIHKTGVVKGADWHGKVNTCLLYAMMLVHLIWYDLSPVISNFSIGLCTLMMLVSFVLYGVRNIQMIQQKPGGN